MSNIVENLRKILTARYGRDVRQSIHDAIHDCYEDGRAGATDIVAREMIADVEAQIAPATTEKAGTVKPDGETITVDEDGTIHSQGGGDEQEIIDLKMLGWTVPKEMPIKNYIDDNGVFHQKIGRVDLGSLDWTYYSNESAFNSSFIEAKNNGITYCYKYINVTDYPTFRNTNNCVLIEYIWSQGINIKTNEYSDSTAFKNAMKQQNVYLYYELATEITIPTDGNEATTNQMLSDEWTSGKTYAQGDFAIYKNTLWKSKVANNLGNTPTEGSYWTATNVGTVVSGISSDLSEKVGKNEVKNFVNFNKVYPIGTSRLDMINDLANSLTDGQGATFSVIINGDNWMFGFITKYDSTQNGGYMVDASGTRYSFTSLSGIIQI